MGGLLSNIRGASCLSAARELSGKTKSVTVGIRASVATCGSYLDDTMSSSHVEEVVEQVRGRDLDPPAKGRGKKDKSRDPLTSLDSWVMRLEIAMADTKEGVDLMEQSMEKAVEDLKVQIQDLQEGMHGSPVPVVSHEEFMRVLDMLASLESRVEVLTKHEEELRQKVAIYEAALSARVMATHEAPRVEVPKPHTFTGKRDAKELDNYLWHMERYFEAIALIDEATKVRTATLYLTDNATLWWRRRFLEIEKGTCTIDTWADFKREIKKQFYPEDAKYLARKKIKYLEHTGSIQDYVKEFSSLMLEAPDMNEKELLFNFMDNLQGWAEQELRRRGVRDLATALAVAESLMDYKESMSSDDEGSRVSHSSSGGEEVSPGGSEDSCSTDGGEEVPQSTARYGKGKMPNTRKDKGRHKQRESAPKLKCFLCNGSHLTRECPKRKALNALIEKSEKTMEDARLGSIQMLGALQVMPKASPQGSETGEQAEVASPCRNNILKGKEKSMGKKARHSRPRPNGYQKKVESSREKEVETILAERVTRKHGVPPMREYLVRWKGLPKRKTSWERENELGKFADWNQRFETAISTGSSMAWVGESVMNSLSRPHHHKGRIPQWAQESPSSPYVRRGNVLEPCGDFFDQSYVEGSRRLWRSHELTL